MPGKRNKRIQGGNVTGRKASGIPQISKPSVQIARNVLQPAFQAAMTIRGFNALVDGEVDLMTLVDGLSAQTRAVQDGDLNGAEAILATQVQTLNVIFHNLARKALRSTYSDQKELNLRLALKAQSQSRATAETLALMKNPPPVAFVRQQNIGVNQQVNNAAIAQVGLPRARETEKLQNRLSGACNELLPDPGASAPAFRVDTSVEALGKIDRTKVNRR